MSQTTGYDYFLNRAQAGQFVDMRPHTVESYAAEGVVGFGRGLVWGTIPGKQVLVPASAEGVSFCGISVFTHNKENVNNNAEYADTDTVNVCRVGMLWVEVTEDVDIDDDAYIDVAEDGKFTNVAESNVATGFKFRTPALTGDLACLEINLIGGVTVMEPLTEPVTTAPPTTEL